MHSGRGVVERYEPLVETKKTYSQMRELRGVLDAIHIWLVQELEVTVLVDFLFEPAEVSLHPSLFEMDLRQEYPQVLQRL